MVLVHAFSRSMPHRRKGRATLLYLLPLAFFGILVVMPFFQGSSEVSVFERQGPPTSFKNPSLLNCNEFLSDARLRKLNITSSQDLDKIYAAYLTKFNPPFWISQHADDKEIVNTGKAMRQQEQTNILEQVLERGRGGEVIFYRPNDAGWFILLAASKPGYRVRIYHPSNQTNSLRLCESIRLNQWDTVKDFNDHDTGDSRIQIVNDPSLQPSSAGTPKNVVLLKLQGDTLAALQSQLVQEAKPGYLWLEFQSASDTSDLRQIQSTITLSGEYDPHWPKSSSAIWSSKSERTCPTPCHLWWKRKTSDT